MESKRWLNIVVDGNIALESYWHDIVSNYLEKIVRTFKGSTQEEESYLGLVMYNADTKLDAGQDIQFINWTKDVNEYLEKISSLSFKGSDEHQYTMAEALAEALVMYPKPSDMMSIIEYKNAERHCILVAAQGEPVAKKLMLCLPMLNKDKQLVSQRLKPSPADFLDVAQRFPQIGVSLSVITPSSLPTFGMIFNLGNDLGLATTPISSYSNGKFTVLLSKKFQQAHYALRGKGLASTTTPATITLPDNNLQDEGNVAPSSDSQMNEYDDMIAELSGGDGDLVFVPSKKTKTSSTTTLEEEVNVEELFDSINNSVVVGQEVSTTEVIPLDDITVVETGFQQQQNNASYNSSAQEGPSTGLLEDILHNKSQLNPMTAPKNCSTSSAFLVSSQQQQLSSVLLPQALESQHGMMSNPSSYNNLLFPQEMGPPSSQTAASLFEMLPRGPMVGGNQYQRNNMTFYAPLSTPTSHEKQILSSPSLDDLRYYNVLTWEGSLVGQVFSIELGVSKAKAYKKPTTPLKLTSDWKDALNITYLMPPDSVDATKNVTHPLDYVFFQVLDFTHVDLYKHLKSTNMYAKLDLPHQIIILSPTEREHLFIGTVFPGYTVFAEVDVEN